MTNTDFSENTLVEQPAIALFGELGYANCQLGVEGIDIDTGVERSEP